ncbi:dynein light chain roadblock-type 2-like [Lytechinus variegatus]|nr:dynein light chain roadblock-type 2-like [Lytechinus variegatus]XP_041455068.1 dynein light chain roadblock-type 2-like [Lytechinus variegatus]XP_054748551.1 dynein light chain roadblock-type 2-like [Lytechinus pictus]
MSEAEETMKRITAHKGVVGTIVMDNDSIPLKTTLDNSTTVQYCQQYKPVIGLARSCVRDIDPVDNLAFLRVRTKRNEVMVAPGKECSLLVIQNPSES